MQIEYNRVKYIVGVGLAVERTPAGSHFHIGLGLGTLTITLPWFAVVVKPWITPDIHPQDIKQEAHHEKV